MRRYVSLLLVLVLCACTRGDPPCPPRSLEVYLEEADAALRNRAKRYEQGEGDLKTTAITFMCGYDEWSPGAWRKADYLPLAFAEVLDCMRTPPWTTMTLTQCLTFKAVAAFTDRAIGAGMTAAQVAEEAKKTTCKELSRNVDIEAEKHGLQRINGLDLVPIIIWAIEAASAPVTAPVMFMIKPGQGGAEQACVDLPADPPKRCSATGDCPDRPEGAEDAGGGSAAGGDVIPPGTDPGTIPGGDYP